jgi:hypothetical protein
LVGGRTETEASPIGTVASIIRDRGEDEEIGEEDADEEEREAVHARER